MKKLVLIAVILLTYGLATAQMKKPVAKDYASIDNFKRFTYLYELQQEYKKLKESLEISNELQKRFEDVIVLSNEDDDDCKWPPGCEIMNPWTCECDIGLENPFPEDVKFRQMRRSRKMPQDPWPLKAGEGAKYMKKLEAALPEQMVNRVKQNIRGYTVGAVLMRTEVYMKALKNRRN